MERHVVSGVLFRLANDCEQLTEGPLSARVAKYWGNVMGRVWLPIGAAGQECGHSRQLYPDV